MNKSLIYFLVLTLFVLVGCSKVEIDEHHNPTDASRSTSSNHQTASSNYSVGSAAQACFPNEAIVISLFNPGAGDSKRELAVEWNTSSLPGVLTPSGIMWVINGTETSSGYTYNFDIDSNTLYSASVMLDYGRFRVYHFFCFSEYGFESQCVENQAAYSVCAPQEGLYSVGNGGGNYEFLLP